MTQHEKILEYMNRFGSITTYDAFRDLGITKLTTRISELRKSGIEIFGVREEAKNRFGEPVSYNRYSLWNSERRV